MIARNASNVADAGDPATLWERLTAPLAAHEIEWRLDGKPVARSNGSGFVARVVPHMTVPGVVKRLNSVVPGEWDWTVEVVNTATVDAAERDDAPARAVKGRIQILGVIREDIGIGPDEKQAATDAFKRTARMHGIGIALWETEQLWVEVDGEGKYAKMTEDPGLAYVRKYGALPGHERADIPRATTSDSDDVPPPRQERPRAASAPTSSKAQHPAGGPQCPKCKGKMWDNRASKRNPKAPDFKCAERSCDGVIWPPKPGQDYGDEPPY